MWALALMAGKPPGRWLMAGALLAGLAIGIRSQVAVLTLPMLALAILPPIWLPPSDGRTRDTRVAIGALGAFTIGVLAWAIPLIVASGGMFAYLHALGSQAGEDFSGGVVMLWTHHSPRETAHALINTFIWPWDWWLGIAVCVLAAVGAARIAWRAPRVLLSIVVVFGPYAIFHLLFQETETTRYALPLLPVVAYAAMAAVEGLPARALPVAAIGMAAISLMQALPASVRYARDGAPVFRAFDDVAATAHGGDRVDMIAIHAGARRAADWATPILPARVAKAPHGREWLTLVALWKAEPSARVWFLADPDRTDLALFDPRARDLARAYRWGFIEPPFVGGARPERHRLVPHAAAQLDAGSRLVDHGRNQRRDVARQGRAAARARDRLAPAAAAGDDHRAGRQASRRRRVARHRDAERLAARDVFCAERLLRALPDAAGGRADRRALYVPLAVTSVGQVKLEQFDAQPPGVPMFAYRRGLVRSPNSTRRPAARGAG